VTRETSIAPNLATAPAPGEVIEAAPGLLWARFPLPFALNHVNVYLVEDRGGWAVVDTGIGDEPTKALWKQLLAGPLRGQRLTRLILTHHHPDHMGLAGWMAREYGLQVHMTEAEYLLARVFNTKNNADDRDGHLSFYRQHGMADEYADLVVSHGHAYRRSITGLPWSYRQMIAGDVLSVGGRDFEIFTGGGHSSEQAMMLSRDEGLFLAADQALPRISPNISVFGTNPDSDPLGQYLISLRQLSRDIPADVLVLPGHNLPFSGLHQRIEELIAHHEARCDLIAAAVRTAPRSAAELVPVLFQRALDPHQMSFAFSETLAHVNRMVRQRRLEWVVEGVVHRVQAA
jgi:glyoxylase-like metal-dependent hydrolase (beta-lactamase superfamily II)